MSDLGQRMDELSRLLTTNQLQTARRVVRKFLWLPKRLHHFDGYGPRWRWLCFSAVEQISRLDENKWLDVAWSKLPLNPVYRRIGLAAIRELWHLFKKWAQCKLYAYDYPRAGQTVDIIVTSTVPGYARKVLLIKRRNDPYKDHWAMPGGFMDMHESRVDAARRELFEETGLEEFDITPLQEAKTFDDPNRDPRDRTITTVFRCELVGDEAKPGNTEDTDDAAEPSWFYEYDLDAIPFAFDHRRILAEVLKG